MQITDAHFGGNIILTRDSLDNGQPFAETLKEINFSGFRYPGGGVTEDQTWANGGLERMFGNPIEPGSQNYVMTIHEALDHSAINDKEITLVVPTFQFYDRQSGNFDNTSFDNYVAMLESAIKDHPDAHIKDIEIGNEYWGSKTWGSLTGFEYGKIANAEIPKLNAMIGRIADETPGWHSPGLGIQAGVQWRATKGDDNKWTADGPQESADIISNISLDHRSMVDTIFQHSYPNADMITQNLNWAVRPMEVFENAEGFKNDLKFTLSEFNIGGDSAIGVDQGAAWIEAFSTAIDLGIDGIDHWGIAYDWLSTKFYDTRFPLAESDSGQIVSIATPMGQVYDIAQSHLVGKSTMSDTDAMRDIQASDRLGVTAFQDDSQKIVFLHNSNEDASVVDLTEIPDGMHVSVRILKPADSPHSPWFDESEGKVTGSNGVADARGDMKVVSGHAVEDQYDIQPGEMIVVTVSSHDRDLVIEGAHNVTDPGTGMVDDLIIGGQGNDILQGHVGDDTIEGGGGKNVISGGRGDDVLVASDEGDVIFADGGNDTVAGGDGNDLIISSMTKGEDKSFIGGGEGRDLFLIGKGGDTFINDWSDDDRIGFGGAFADADAMRNATQVVAKDIVVTLPDGSQVVLVGQADAIETLPDRVLDFMTREDITVIMDGYLKDLSYKQVVEIFEQKNNAFEPMNTEDGKDLYFDELERTVERLELEPQDAKVPEEEAPGGGESPQQPDDNTSDPGDGNSGTEDEHFPPPDEDNTPDPWPDDPHADQNDADASGGACFVATAAYGNPHHPDVVALRKFRDKHLIRTAAGRWFVRFYWLIGPKLAAHVNPKQVRAAAARCALARFVSFLRVIGMTAGQ